ncbi:glycoside hydrolase family 28 protein [Pleomassaria siparia CBS 279.74]|uniref:Glycoside hydrolase family 28 protein n=1 Tax=Pleomassaria siparia CBS 279.74 TaxID=1314801 RepID=A0A6G1JZ92_9PLEO|nr:glycoside hydrolase family 28 protein [Pleomassaria siparia CBS 279.74]
MYLSQVLLGAVALLPAVVVGQLSGKVGPLTTHAAKTAKKTCSVLDYGAKADKSTDIGPPLAAAWAACKTGGTVVVPSGDYAMNTWVTLSGGSAWALQLDGVIYRTGTAGGNMIFVGAVDDFELFSSTGKGAIQGNGYEIHAQGSRTGARILRLNKVTNFSVHDVVLVDAPAFHFSMDTCTNGEVYNMAIRGGDWGGLDGIDVWSNNIWIHDVMVTNKDECVTVKSPSKNILIENIYCNSSGGCALGSLGADTAISQVHYKNVYTWSSNQMMMIKSNGGSGYVEDVVFENFIGHGNAYSLDVDQYWSSMSAVAGDGVQLSNITFTNWKGTEADGASRGPVKIVCADGAPCTDISVTDLAMWTETGSKQTYTCRSAYGSGACLKAGSAASYAAVTSTQTAAPAGYTAASMAADLKTAFGTTVSIPIPAIPTSYYPGAAPYSAIAGA